MNKIQKRIGRAVRKFLDGDGVYRYPNGREVCADSAKGNREYTLRRRSAWERQKGMCPLCKLSLGWGEATTDHIKPRKMGGSERDDRPENLQAVHLRCNSEKGSKRI